MKERVDRICTDVLDMITPRKAQRARIEALARRMKDSVVSASKDLGVEVEASIEGSVAKDTWLSDEPDIDVFMRVPTTLPRKSLGEVCLEIARKAAEGSRQIERFAEHPYLEAIVNDTRVNIVPCYDVKGKQWISATDRTPFHTGYVKNKLTKQMKGEVRLLKRFMKGIGVYGAEIKTGGFSGYLCELLIIHHKSFRNTLKAFAEQKRRATIDIEGHYNRREGEIQLLFKEDFVVIDPVDKGRNVASAVRPQRLYTFIAAARAFLKNPNMKFFYPPETAALPVKELRQKLTARGSSIIFLTFGKVDTVPDVLWGQLLKSQRSLHKLIRLNDFTVLRNLSWSNEEDANMFIFEVEQRIIPPVKKHLGPPLERKDDCEKFLLKHVTSPNTASGPYIENGKWVVEIRRKHTDAVVLLEEKLKDGGRDAGVAEKISRVLRQDLMILVNDEIVEIYMKNREFARFLTDLLSGKPKWLEDARQD